MQAHTTCRFTSRSHCRVALVLVVLLAALCSSSVAKAQEKRAPIAPPGDTLTHGTLLFVGQNAAIIPLQTNRHYRRIQRIPETSLL